jgi:heme exporter protein C
MSQEGKGRALRTVSLHVLAAALLSAAVVGIFLLAPAEETMGDVQRIMYVHVAVAWFSLMACVAMAGSGIGYLATRNLAWDHWSHAATEVGWLAATLTLATGSLWARMAWGAWWTWDPRLTTVFLLWAIYSGCLLVRGGVEEPRRAARLGAVLAVVALLDLPLIVLATHWFRGIHPKAPVMEPGMRTVLWLSVAGFGSVLALLLARRRSQLRFEHVVDSLEEETPEWARSLPLT